MSELSIESQIALNAERAVSPKPVCPKHGMTDCSPLLNGCSRLTSKKTVETGRRPTGRCKLCGGIRYDDGSCTGGC